MTITSNLQNVYSQYQTEKKELKVNNEPKQIKEETNFERVKREIESGTYKVDLNKIAELIAKELI